MAKKENNPKKPKNNLPNQSPKGKKQKAAGQAAAKSELYKTGWRQIAAILLIILAVLVVFGGVGVGGRLPQGLFNTFSYLIGQGAWFLAPAGIGYWGWLLFNKKSGQVVGRTHWLMVVTLILGWATWLQLVAGQSEASTLASDGSGGGFLGWLLAWPLLRLLSHPVSLFVVSLLVIIFSLLLAGVTPKKFLESLQQFKNRPRVSKKTANLKINRPLKNLTSQTKEVLTVGPAKLAKKEFRLNPGVPVGKSKEKSKPETTESALTVSQDLDWEFPSSKLLSAKQDRADAGDVQANAETIKETLANFNIDVEMEGANIGPRVTQYTLRPPAGTRLSKITGLESNIALDLAAPAIRIEAPIPGKRAVGIEVPNKKGATVLISDLLASSEFKKCPQGSLAFAIGKDITGQPVVGQLEKMPHLMLAGQTGAGKSVAINALLTSLLYRCSPSQLRLILVDPKQVELAPYNDIPHLLAPVITEPEKCISALKWGVAEMERRLKTFAGVGRRNIVEYNRQAKSNAMPFIVIVIDELADLMMMAARDVESLIVRIAQKARAAGIHIVLATQRPSVDVITGLIKANVPARIAFTVASQIDSRTIIDQAGAEKLLGQGDILYQTASNPKPVRVQGALVTDEETAAICQFLKDQRPAEYDDEVVSQPVSLSGGRGQLAGVSSQPDEEEDELWRPAVEAVILAKKASTSLLQRRLRIGYARAARLIETMEERGIIGPADGAKPRPVLIASLDELKQIEETANFDDQEDLEMATSELDSPNDLKSQNPVDFEDNFAEKNPLNDDLKSDSSEQTEDDEESSDF